MSEFDLTASAWPDYESDAKHKPETETVACGGCGRPRSIGEFVRHEQCYETDKPCGALVCRRCGDTCHSRSGAGIQDEFGPTHHECGDIRALTEHVQYWRNIRQGANHLATIKTVGAFQCDSQSATAIAATVDAAMAKAMAQLKTWREEARLLNAK